MAAEGFGFDDAVSYYKSLMKHLYWNDLGQVFAGRVMAVEYIEGKSVLEEARKLGVTID